MEDKQENEDKFNAISTIIFTKNVKINDSDALIIAYKLRIPASDNGYYIITLNDRRSEIIFGAGASLLEAISQARENWNYINVSAPNPFAQISS